LISFFTWPILRVAEFFRLPSPLIDLEVGSLHTKPVRVFTRIFTTRPSSAIIDLLQAGLRISASSHRGSREATQAVLSLSSRNLELNMKAFRFGGSGNAWRFHRSRPHFCERRSDVLDGEPWFFDADCTSLFLLFYTSMILPARNFFSSHPILKVLCSLLVL